MASPTLAQGASRMSELYRLPTGGTRAAGVYPLVVMGCTCLFFLSLWAGTQTVASLWGYAPVLGRAMSYPDTRFSSILLYGGMLLSLLSGILVWWKSSRGWVIPVTFLALYCFALR